MRYLKELDLWIDTASNEYQKAIQEAQTNLDNAKTGDIDAITVNTDKIRKYAAEIKTLQEARSLYLYIKEDEKNK